MPWVNCSLVGYSISWKQSSLGKACACQDESFAASEFHVVRCQGSGAGTAAASEPAERAGQLDSPPSQSLAGTTGTSSLACGPVPEESICWVRSGSLPAPRFAEEVAQLYESTSCHAMLQQTRRFWRPKGQIQSLSVPLPIPLEMCVKNIGGDSHLRLWVPGVGSQQRLHGEERDLPCERCIQKARGGISHPQLPVSPV